MHLKTVHIISKYKNLDNFKLDFDGSSFIDVFVGKNGTGKSNLFEALIEIFRHLYEFDNRRGRPNIGFEYLLKYEINSTITEIEWKSGKLTINVSVRPTHIAGLVSGSDFYSIG
jgi:recombinational DNA repair ATPase RecF